jgi:TonB family protein
MYQGRHKKGVCIRGETVIMIKRVTKRLTILKNSVIHIARAAVALLGTIFLFAVLPLAHGIFKLTPDDLKTTALKAPVIMKQTILEDKERKKTELRVRNLNVSDSKTKSTSRSMNLSMRFTPDLGIGNGDGVGLNQNDFGSTVFNEGDVDELPRVLSRLEVEYPRRAKDEGIEGTVILILLIDRNGKVENVYVESSPSPLFIRPVKQTVIKWKFAPARYQGVPVKVRMRQDITFELDKS